jgi:hypothetical protein
MHSRHILVELPERSDDRGSLVFGQEGGLIPFPIKRFFAIYGVAEDASRGAHAHREQHQFLVMLTGQARVTIKNGCDTTQLSLDRPTLALHAPPMLWLELDGFSREACCLVLTSDVYRESDYIRDWETFSRLTANGE